MDYAVILNNINRALDRKYPSGASKNNILRKVLDLDKMGAYRRLNGMVQFKVSEVARLCAALEIPVETVFDLNKGKTISMNLFMTNYSSIAHEDNLLLEKAVELLDRASKSGNSRFVVSTNMIPHTIINDFGHLLRLCLCKWVYFNNESGLNIPFREVRLPQDLTDSKREMEKRMHRMKSTVLIWDQRVIESTLSDMSYFYRINLLTDDEVLKLKEDLHNYINYMDLLATRGCYEQTGNPVQFYISSVSLDCNYGFIDSDNVKASIIQAFVLHQAWSEDPESFGHVKSWMNTLIRSSTLVSTSGELSRIEFFNKQRRAIDSFKG